MRKHLKLLSFILFPVLMGVSGSSYRDPDGMLLRYEVSENETVSEILHALSSCNLWGKNHLVEQTLKLNHIRNEIAAKRLKPGRILKIPIYSKNKDSVIRVLNEKSSEIQIYRDRSYCENAFAFVREMEPTITPTPFASSSPVPVPTPIEILPTNDRIPSDEERAVSSIGMSAFFNYHGFNSLDLTSKSSSIVLSRLSPGAELYWKLQWQKTFQTIASIAFERYTLNQYSAFKTIDNPTGNRLAVFISGIYEWAINWNLKGSFGMAEQLYSRSQTSSTVVMDAVSISYLDFAFGHRWYQGHGIELSQEINAKLYFPVSQDLYNIKTGYGYGTEGMLSHYFSSKENQKIFLKMFYQFRLQNTSITNNTNASIGFGLGYEKKLGDD